MMNRIRFLITGVLLVLGSSLMMAQSDWDPENPPEPSAMYRITVSSSPNYGYTSGAGWYRNGDQVWISTSSYDVGYVFLYWTKNGEKYSEEQYFTYTVEEENVDFVAYYEYSPQSPGEPDGIVSYRLYLKSNIQNCCSFSRTSGEKVRAGDNAWVAAYANQGYSFLGWYLDEELVSESSSFYYQMPEKDVTLVARFEYDPDNPGDPFDVTQPITPKIWAKSYERYYGMNNPDFGYVKNINMEGEPYLWCEANEYSPVGTYPIKVERGSIEGEDLELIEGTLTIIKAPLVAQGDNYVKIYGSENPDFPLIYDGFKNGEDESVLTEKPTVSCSADKDSTPGEYVVSVSGGDDDNYSISCVDGKLTIIEADTIAISAGSFIREYGEANPAFTYSVYGGIISGEPEITCEATATSPVGTYDIIISQGSVDKENCKYVKGTLTITKALLTISAGTYTRKQFDANPEFTLTYSGFKNEETSAVLTTQPTVTCSATKDSDVGDYDVLVSGAEATNYDITYVNGKLIVEANTFTTEGDENKEEDDAASYRITSGDESNPTVALTNGDSAAGTFEIPETVVYNGKTYIVTTIAYGAFLNNTNLVEVTIPGTITNIEGNAFKGCTNLQSIILNIALPIDLTAVASSVMTRAGGSSIFDGVNMETCILYVPDGSVELYKTAPVWKDFANIRSISSYGISSVIMTDDGSHDVFDLQGRKVRSKVRSLDGLSRGVYIVKGKKLILK